MRRLLTCILSVTTLGLTGRGYNSFQSTDEQIKASGADVRHPYQRQSYLVPHLVSTVKVRDPV
jgi:LemA protein